MVSPLHSLLHHSKSRLFSSPQFDSEEKRRVMQGAIRSADAFIRSQFISTLILITTTAGVASFSLTGDVLGFLRSIAILGGLYVVQWSFGRSSSVEHASFEYDVQNRVVESVHELQKEVERLREATGRQAERLRQWTQEPEIERAQPSYAALEIFRRSMARSAAEQEAALRQYRSAAQAFTLIDSYRDREGRKVYVWEDPMRPGPEFQVTYVLEKGSSKPHILYGSKAQATVAFAPGNGYDATLVEIADGRHRQTLSPGNQRPLGMARHF